MDRKAWIIIIFCVALLGVNMYYSNENKKQAETHQKQLTEQQAPAQAPSQTEQPAPANKAGLVVPPPPVNPDVKTWDLIVDREHDGKATSIVKYTFTNIGGSIRTVEMIGSAIDSRKMPDVDVTLNAGGETQGIGSFVFGMSASQDPVFDTAEYRRVDDGKDPSSIKLAGRTANGLAILKEYNLTRIKDEDGKQLPGSDYMVNLKVTVENATEHTLRISDMGIFAGAGYPVAKSEQKDAFTHFFYMHDGNFTQETPGYFTGGFFSSAKNREFVTNESISYAGVMSQYYVTTIIPMEKSRGDSIFAKRQLFHLTEEQNAEVPGVVLAMGLPIIDLQPGQQHVLEYSIYTGPKLNQVLRALPYDLDKVMAYGWFTFLSVPMNWLLNFFHGWVGNWGIAIICLTIVVRICIWPLHKKSYMSMKRMSLVQPKLQELKEKYGNDQQKMSAEMMNLYKEYGINPMSGCIPMLFQIPIFFAFYRVLQYSAELRGEPFFLWIKDLSLPDTVFEIPLPFDSFPYLPINILPVLMAVTMIIQMKMTPQAGDKTQQRIMAFMPWMFFLFCYNFASALALYWTTQNIISMGQTMLIRRLPQPVLTKSDKKKKPGFLQRMMEQQRIAMEQQQKKAKAQGGGNMRNVTPKKKK